MYVQERSACMIVTEGLISFPNDFLYWKGLIYLPIVCTCFSAVVPVQKRHRFLIIFSVCLLQIL